MLAGEEGQNNNYETSVVKEDVLDLLTSSVVSHIPTPQMIS